MIEKGRAMTVFDSVRLLAVVALVALLGSACGNDDDTTAEAPAVTSALPFDTQMSIVGLCRS